MLERADLYVTVCLKPMRISEKKRRLILAAAFVLVLILIASVAIYLGSWPTVEGVVTIRTSTSTVETLKAVQCMVYDQDRVAEISFDDPQSTLKDSVGQDTSVDYLVLMRGTDLPEEAVYWWSRKAPTFELSSRGIFEQLKPLECITQVNQVELKRLPGKRTGQNSWHGWHGIYQATCTDQSGEKVELDIQFKNCQ